MPATLTDLRPRFSEAEAAAFACDHYGLTGTPQPLPSDRDQNFRLVTATGDAFVLKIASAGEQRGFLEAQHAALRHLATAEVPVPRVVPSIGGEDVLTWEGQQHTHLARVLTYLPGVPLGDVHPQRPPLMRSLGQTLGRLSAALDGFDHPGAHWDFAWDVRHAPDAIRARLDLLATAAQRDRVLHFLVHFEQHVAPTLAGLRHSVIHGDANDYNVLVTPPTQPERRIAGLVDFGDLVHTVTAAEVAIGAAYAMLDQPDPLATLRAVVAGYHAAFPLTEDELAVVFPLVCARLCVSVCMSAERKQDEPANDYLTISARPAWDLLGLMQYWSPRFVAYALREACGLEPCPAAPRLRQWLADHAPEAAPIVHPDPRTNPVKVFDFSVGSTERSHLDLTTPMRAADALAAQMADAGAEVGVGRYDEPRLVYSGPQFQEALERRTRHIGLDLFQPAGSPVFAPLAGTVAEVHDYDEPFDYGPTVVLEHTPEPGLTFYSLYGHLSRADLPALTVGQRLEKGAQVGTLGAPEENGGWSPHLHFQLMTDLFGETGNFPGVAPPSLRRVWTSLCPDPNLLLGIPEAAFPPPVLDADAIWDLRKKHLGPSLSLSYREPLHIVRGYMQHLYDAEGRAYLDAVNNVPHVGHSHPRVVAAAQQQMAVLNTNTRYLHENLARYAERLAATLPEPLSVCFFVNSGSEANDLALRLVQACTGRRDLLVLDAAYHGNLTSVVGLSPYKFDGPGGSGAPPTTHVCPRPDPYRGRHRGADAAAQYAEEVRQQIEQMGAKNRPPAAFIAESILSCGGQIVMPDGFLREAYRQVRAAGGRCIADEVQVGFGRVGTHFWGFETQGVVPDIVTMGKPIGNGHPLGAVVTTPEIAAAFANGMEYFNTYGGNPVSCAVGLAVLDVIEDEGLQAKALHVGTQLREGLAALQDRHPVIGEVRGRGLFLGVELVRDRVARTPAPDVAAYVANRMRDHRILLSTDGPQHNVLKIKPPLAFINADADRLVATLDAVLAEDFARVASEGMVA